MVAQRVYVTKAGWTTGESKDACQGCGACDSRLAIPAVGSEVEETKKVCWHLPEHEVSGLEQRLQNFLMSLAETEKEVTSVY